MLRRVVTGSAGKLIKQNKKICIIGAGASGVTAVKSCVEEGLNPICYDMRDGIGGLWLYKRAENLGGRSRVYESVVTNASKEASCFSDFPYPKEQTPYCSHTKVVEYFNNYVKHFDLEKHFKFTTVVESVVRIFGDDGEHKWKVAIRDLQSSKKDVIEYDAVIISGGRDGRPKWPNTEGLSDGTYKGQVLHSVEYDSPEIFEGKSVVVIGLGNSGADISSEVCKKATKTFMSTSSGSWLIPRLMKGGLPEDMTIATRFNSLLNSVLPKSIKDRMLKKILNTGFDQDVLGLAPRPELGDTHPNFLTNDELPSRIVSGQVMIKPVVTKFDEDSVYFSDGTKEKVDVVICSTGFHSHFPFISDDILPDDRSQMKLFEWMFPFEMENPESLAVVGVIPFSGGSQMVQVECQARYVAQIMSGVKKLPPMDEMKKAYEDDISTFVGEGESFIFRREVGFDYQDRVATLAGFYPSLWKLFLRDPRLASAVYFGPFMSYQYRLFGRHQWKPARERILNAIPNTLYAIKSDIRNQK